MDFNTANANYSPVTVASPGEVVGAIVAALAIVGALFVVSMFLYFVVRRRFAHCKWAVEVAFVGFAVLVAAGLNVFLFCYANRHDITFASAVAYTFHGLFNGFGSLTFNGADSPDGALPYLFCSFYYGSSFYAALMFFGILTAKANYEVFSKLILLLPEHNKDVYVLTALNAETLMLAKTLVQKETGHPSIIIFAIPSQTPFDRHDELCREVMSNGFYYWSYSPDTEHKRPWLVRLFAGDTAAATHKRSIAQTLHLNNHNGTFAKDNRFYIFAFDSDNYIPQEEQNMATVFDDIERRGGADKIDDLRINYVILTKRQVKYAAYDYKLRELRHDYYSQLQAKYQAYCEHNRADLLDELWQYLARISPAPTDAENQIPPLTLDDFFDVPDDMLKDYCLSGKLTKNDVLARYQNTLRMQSIPEDKIALYTQRIQWIDTWLPRIFKARFAVEIWDEANVIAKSVLAQSTDLLGEIFARPDPSVKVLTLGFGETGTAATMALYSHSAFVDRDLKANAFTAHVYDAEAERIGHSFAHERPYACVSIWDKRTGATEVIRDRKQIDEQIRNLNASVDPADIENEMQYPQMIFTGDDCNKLDFVDDFDREDARPDFVVVSTGDDYANVRLANAIIQKVVNAAVVSQAPQRRMDVFVNVWDNANNALVISGGGKWQDNVLIIPRPDDADRVLLAVHIVGNNDMVYSADTTIEVDHDAAFNYYYEEITDELNAKQPKGGFSRADLNRLNALLNHPATITEADYPLIVGWAAATKRELLSEVTDMDPLEQRLTYYGLELWLKESSAMACLNAPLYYRLMTDWHVDDAGTEAKEQVRRYVQLASMEHQRWLRLHIAFGWIYNGKGKKQELIQHHHCLTPYAYVNQDTVLYDLANVLMAWRYGAPK